jgi:hypothetical protein
MSVSRVSEWKIIWRNLMASPSEAHLRAMELERHVNALKAELADLRKGDWVGRVFDAEAEVRRLQYERNEWFSVAQRLRDAILGTEQSDIALDNYLRVRGRLEDPRDCIEETYG